MATGSKSRKGQETPTLVPATNGTKLERLKQLYGEWYGCEKCLLHSFRKFDDGTPMLDICFGDGNPDSPVMIIGEGPGAEEETSGIPFVGPSGQLLNKMLASVSDNPDIRKLFNENNKARRTRAQEEEFNEQLLAWRKSEFFVTNVVACRPPENRTPTKPEIKACWPRLHNIIDIVDPWLIITCGKAAIESLVRKNIEITKLRGSIFEVEIRGRVTTYKTPVMATLHPSFLLRVADYKMKDGSYIKTLRDFRKALVYVDALKAQYSGTPMPVRPNI